MAIYWKDVHGLIVEPIAPSMLQESGCVLPVRVGRQWKLSKQQLEDVTVNHMVSIKFDKAYAMKHLTRFLLGRLTMRLSLRELALLVLEWLNTEVICGQEMILTNEELEKVKRFSTRFGTTDSDDFCKWFAKHIDDLYDLEINESTSSLQKLGKALLTQQMPQIQEKIHEGEF